MLELGGKGVVGKRRTLWIRVIVSQQYDVAKIINEKGCVQAGEEWMERNLLIVAGIAVATAFLQVCTYHSYQWSIH